MAEQFKPANKFSDFVGVAAAAVEWQGLSSEQQALVVVEEGIPFLAGVPDLTHRAEAIAEAAQRGLITGLIHTEDGDSLRVERMQLNRESLDAWIEKTEKRVHTNKQTPAATTSDSLLKEEDVLLLLNISRSTLYRKIKTGNVEDAHLEHPKRWRKSYIDSLISEKASN